MKIKEYINLSPFNNVFSDPFWRSFWNTQYRVHFFAIPLFTLFYWYVAGYFPYQVLASYVFVYTFINFYIYFENNN